MAGGSLLILLDDIAAVLDDVALMTKVAAKKTIGVLGDDLAVNAEKVTGVRAERELPVVWAVAKGSFRNKCILVPAALIISFVAPWLIGPVLILGGLFLCYEGFEKVAETFFHSSVTDTAHGQKREARLAEASGDVVQYEQTKIKGAIRTDFILSAEIIVLTLGVVTDMNFLIQVLVVSTIALSMTIGVYGLVAGIVKIDDAGLYLMERKGQGAWLKVLRWLGWRLVIFAPWLMKLLTVVGTVAMFMVGGGILVHGFHGLQEAVESLSASIGLMETFGPMLEFLAPTLCGIFIGIVAGAVMLGGVTLWHRLRGV
ncbi:MAG: DUF808 domain-containing protein [Halioglobus sp.]|nr:DUF808 domain-containing protein [Halioglobus sp.]